MRAFSDEPSWLRGVSWPLVGMVAAIAVMQNVPQFMRALVPCHCGDGQPLEFAFLDLATHLIVGLLILLIAAFLINLRRPRVPLALALGTAVVVGSLIPFNVIGYWIFGPESDGRPIFLSATAFARRTALPWAIAAVAWYFFHRAAAREAALRAEAIAQRQLESGTLEARLQALQAQVEPHFLFNTLAHVRRLYRTNPVRARLMLDSFRAYLRSALPRMRGGTSTLGREIDLAQAYLDVQRVRMGRRLSVAVDVPAGLRARALPPMMLISLVENAIKHGLSPLPGGGTIAVAAAEHDGRLEVRVTDNGAGMGDDIGSGVGLANIRDRLEALFGSDAALALSPHAPSGVTATIRVPSAPVEDLASAAEDEAAVPVDAPRALQA
jgi:signal transduction histidine kinase